MTATSTVAADQLFEEAQAVLAGGVSASMRLHPYLGRPLYVERGEGAVPLRSRRQALHRLQHVERRGAAGTRSPGGESGRCCTGSSSGSSPPPRRRSTSSWRRGWSRSSRPPSGSASPASAAR